MSATDFSTVYLDEPGQSSSATSLGDVAVAEAIDLNDPSLLSGEVDTNTDTDPYAAPPPVADGRYRVKLKQIDVKREDGTTGTYNVKRDKSGKPYAYCALEATIDAPGTPYDGQKIWDRFVSTMAQRNGGIPLAWILVCLGKQVPQKASAQVLVDEFTKALAAEPSLEVETVWEGGLDEATRQSFKDLNEKQPRVLGMHRFPKNADGTHSPDMEYNHPKMGKINLHAQARISGYFKLGSGKK